MNFRQIRLLNDLERKVSAFFEEVARIDQEIAKINDRVKACEKKLSHGFTAKDKPRHPSTGLKAMKMKIDTPEGRKTYSKRLGIVEPVFGNIRSCKRMDRFTLRGQVKVNIQWMLYCLVHNIEKIANFGKSYSIQGV